MLVCVCRCAQIVILCLYLQYDQRKKQIFGSQNRTDVSPSALLCAREDWAMSADEERRQALELQALREEAERLRAEVKLLDSALTAQQASEQIVDFLETTTWETTPNQWRPIIRNRGGFPLSGVAAVMSAVSNCGHACVLPCAQLCRDAGMQPLTAVASLAVMSACAAIWAQQPESHDTSLHRTIGLRFPSSHASLTALVRIRVAQPSAATWLASPLRRWACSPPRGAWRCFRWSLSSCESTARAGATAVRRTLSTLW